MAITRRRFLQGAAFAGAASLVPLYLSRSAHGEYNYKPEDFIAPLAIPPEYHGRIENGKRVFDLILKHGESEFFSGYKTPTIGINANYLGMVLRVRRGDRVTFNVKNRLNQTSTLHWHGVHLPAQMDGGPHQEIVAGATWQPEFTIRQPASTQWYHSHVHNYTGPQVYQGLAGLLYIDDENSLNHDIPKSYGVDDIPLVIQDRNFNRDGSFRYITNMHERMAGIHGGHILVNGVIRPKHVVSHKLTRLRILNGSNARIYNLRFSDNRSFMQIASDGGFLESPVSLTQLRLAPGERAEIIVEFDQNDDVMLEHEALPVSNFGAGMSMMSMMMSGGNQSFRIMRFTSKNLSVDSSTIPMKLASIRRWEDSQANVIRQFELDMSMGMGMMSGMRGKSGFTINNQSFDINRIDEIVRLNDTEVWEFTNKSPMPHPMHIHDIQFLILSRNGNFPDPNERGFKDTVLVNPNETVRLITKFENYADQQSPYMFHCHILEHEDQGMMGQFVVT